MAFGDGRGLHSLGHCCWQWPLGRRLWAVPIGVSRALEFSTITPATTTTINIIIVIFPIRIAIEIVAPTTPWDFTRVACCI